MSPRRRGGRWTVSPMLLGLLAAATAIAGAATSPARRAPATNVQSAHPTAAEIERLLSDPDADELSARQAVVIARRIAADFDDRDIARFLHQYGRGLARSGAPDAGVVMLARTFVLFPESRSAPPALLDAARIHRASLRDEETAVRLARRAVALARSMGLAEVAAEGEIFLASPPSLSPPSAPAADSPPDRPAAKDPS